MVEPRETAAAILLCFFGVGILLAIDASLYGGDVRAITSGIRSLAGPIAVVAILVSAAVATINMVAE